MKHPKRSGFLFAASAAAVLLSITSIAHARSDVYFSVGVGGVPVYVEPAPVYVQPPPVYVDPRPAYVAPAPVYVQPGPPVFVGPRYYRYDYDDAWRYRHWRHHHGWNEDRDWD